MEKKIKIFYSWQSDTDKNTNMNAIRQSLRVAINNIEHEKEDLIIKFDESTRDVSGSPNIPSTILEKIETSDIFICDLSTINNYAPSDKRKLQNPNVLIELGYAIAHIGWERILMLFNETTTKVSDLPFDIDRHRASKFSIKDKSDKTGKSQLTKLLEKAILLIDQNNPVFPLDSRNKTAEEKKREVTENNLKWVLSTIHIPTFDYFIENLPLKIIDDIFHFWESYKAILESSQFYIYDEDAMKLLTNLKKLWGISLSYSHRYNSNSSGRNYNYYIPGDVFPDKESEKDFNLLTKNTQNLYRVFKDLIKYIRENYINIDLDNTSKSAYDEYIQFHKDFEKLTKNS